MVIWESKLEVIKLFFNTKVIFWYLGEDAQTSGGEGGRTNKQGIEGTIRNFEKATSAYRGNEK